MGGTSPVLEGPAADRVSCASFFFLQPSQLRWISISDAGVSEWLVLFIAVVLKVILSPQYYTANL
jgi:hypothetical protein